MKDRARLEASIDRFRRGFWDREAIDRPPVGVLPDRAWLPINYLREPLHATAFLPADVRSTLVRTDYEDAAAHRSVTADDWLPWAAAWRAVPWLEAMSGCPVHAGEGSLAPDPWAASVDDLRDLALPREAGWFDRLEELTADLVATAPDDCFVSTTILRGPADVLGAIRGLTNFYLDLIDAPEIVAAAAAEVNKLHLAVLDRHFATVTPHLGGYGHIYGFWSPEPTTVIQDDVLGMCAPAVFRDLFLPCAAQIVEHLGSRVLFHLHSTGYAHYRHVLEVPGLAGVEVTVEPIGPSLHDLLPALRVIAERSRLLLMVDAHVGELASVARQLPTDGVYVAVSDRFIGSDRSFRQLVSSAWPGSAVP
jgi:hypothetical protein